MANWFNIPWFGATTLRVPILTGNGTSEAIGSPFTASDVDLSGDEQYFATIPEPESGTAQYALEFELSGLDPGHKIIITENDKANRPLITGETTAVDAVDKLMTAGQGSVVLRIRDAAQLSTVVSWKATLYQVGLIAGGGQAGSGTGDTIVDQDLGGTDNLRYTVNGQGVDNGTVRAYEAGRYDSGDTSNGPDGTAVTGPDGRWVGSMYLNQGYTYVFEFEKPGVYAVSQKRQQV